MNCPNCPSTPLVMSERSGVEIDYCPKCRGIWLDRGELDKIIERNRSELGSAPHDVSRDVGYRSKPYKRKKSFLEELFD